MKVIGLTGGTGSGKGLVCQCFQKHNINSIDTDKVAREVCDVGKPCLLELVSVFGETILNQDSSLNRKALASIVFSDKDKLSKLNSITHRYILDTARLWLKEQQRQNKPAAIVDAPLLFESGFDKECDVIISVVSDKKERIARLLERDGITKEQIQKRFDNQHDDEFYKKNSHYVITNNGTKDELQAEVDALFSLLFKEDRR